MKCLIINDEKASWKILEKQVSKAFDFSEFFFAINGEEGIELAKQKLPDLIILDIVMPGLDGFQVLNLLKSDELTKHIPVVIITNKVKDDGAQIKAMSIGASAFLHLPLDENELVNEVKKALTANNVNYKIKEHRDFLSSADLRMPERKKFTKEQALYFDEFKEKYSESIDLNELLFNERDAYKGLLHALKLSEKRYRTLFDNNRDLLFLLKKNDGNFIIIDANKAAIAKLRIEKNELMNSNLCNYLESGFGNFNDKIDSLIEGKIDYWETKLKNSMGELFPVELEFHKLAIPKEEIYIASLRDISERKKMEKHLRLLSLAIQNSPISVVLTDNNGNIQYVNEFFTNLTGYEEEEIIGENPRIQKSGVHSQKFYENLWNTIKNGDIWQGRFCNKKKSGEIYWEQAVITPITDEDGVITNYVALKVDVTNQVKLFEELKQAKLKAEKSEQLKSEFLAKVSHEIRTPLNAIINLSNLLAEEIVDAHDEFLIQSKQGIISAGKRLTRTVDLILYLSMLETGNYKVQKERAVLSKLLENLIEEYKVQALNKGLEFDFTNELTEADYCFCDSFAVEQIVANLLDNAIKFTNEGKVKVELLKTTEGKFVVNLIDTGIGIPKEKMKDIFSAFYQIESGYTKKYEGLGVGLSVAKKFADLNGYELYVEPAEEKGTKATLIVQ